MQGTYQRMRSYGKKRAERPLHVGLFFILFTALLAIDGGAFFSQVPQPLMLVAWLRYACSALTSFIFCVVGALVWRYARERLVAKLLLAFCTAMMLCFSLSTAAIQERGPFSPFGFFAAIGAQFAIFTLGALLLYFPVNHFSRPAPGPPAGDAGERSIPGRARRWLASKIVPCYVGVGSLLLVLATTESTLYDLVPHGALPPLVVSMVSGNGFLNSAEGAYYFLLSTGITVTVIVSFRLSSGRARQQLRLFVAGVLLAILPVLFLTEMPAFITVPPQNIVDPVVSTLPTVLLPLALGYAVLRHQVLAFDRTVRRAVTLTIGGMTLATLGYLDILFCGAFLPNDIEALCVTGIMGAVVPLVWWGVRLATEWLFSPETATVLRLLYEPSEPNPIAPDPFDLPRVASTIEQAAARVLGTDRVCLLVLEEERGIFQPVALPPPGDAPGQREELRRNVLHHLLFSLSPTCPGNADSIEASAPFLASLEGVWPALSLGDLLLPTRERAPLRRWIRWGPGRFFAQSPSGEPDSTLLVPVRVQGTLIGLLVLGARETGAPYAGPDFETIGQLLLCFSGVLQTARLFGQVQRSIEVLSAFCRTNANEHALSMQVQVAGGVPEVVSACTAVAQQVLSVDAEFWLADEDEGALRPQFLGSGRSRLTEREELRASHPSDRGAWFLEPGHQDASPGHADWPGPSCLPERPALPLAWLPLRSGSHFHGILALLYRGPHRFSAEERDILGRFADHCAADLESARIRLDMNARARQQRFSMRERHEQLTQQASQTLREPLQRLQEYFDLFRREQDAQYAPEQAESSGARTPAGKIAAIMEQGEAGSIPETPTQPMPFHTHAQELQVLLRSLRSLLCATHPGQAKVLVNSTVDSDLAAILMQAEHGLRPVVVVAREPMAGLLTSALRVAGYTPIALPSLPKAHAWLVGDGRADAPVPVAIVLDIASLPSGRDGLSVESDALRSIQACRDWKEPPPLLALVREGPRWKLRITSAQGKLVAEESSITVSELLNRIHACLREH